jgi:hypothetical protein
VQSGEHEFAIGSRNGSSYETIDTSREETGGYGRSSASGLGWVPTDRWWR